VWSGSTRPAVDRSWFARFVRDASGSVTVESVLVMPVVLALTCLFLFLGLYLFERADLQQKALLVSVRAAAAWVCCGSVASNGQDAGDRGLYWRWSEGWETGWWRGDGADAGTARLSLPPREETPTNSVLTRLASAAQTLPAYIHGELKYGGFVLGRHVAAALRSVVGFPEMISAGGDREASGYGRSLVVDPAESVRNVQWIKEYAERLRSRYANGSEAKRDIQRFLELEGRAEFARHDEAADYLRKLVSGYATQFTLASGEVRMADAMTASGVLHQAYLTFRESQLRIQMRKDAELLRQGNPVKSVVWHFFRKKGSKGEVGPSAAFLSELAQNGIVVVIHE